MTQTDTKKGKQLHMHYKKSVSFTEGEAFIWNFLWGHLKVSWAYETGACLITANIKPIFPHHFLALSNLVFFMFSQNTARAHFVQGQLSVSEKSAVIHWGIKFVTLWLRDGLSTLWAGNNRETHSSTNLPLRYERAISGCLRIGF